jgi:hypothetical protein
VSSDYEYAGGLAGESLGNSTINNSYSTGSVSGVTYVGGLTGSNSSSTITNCYSTGSVTGTTSVGGMIGTASSSTVTNSFWNTETSGQPTSAGGTGKTTAELKEYATFYFKDGWDFMDETLNGSGNMWGLNPAENNGYPFLSFQGFTHAPVYTVISHSTSAITATTATFIGTAGDLSITQHGFCWNTSGNPTVDNSKNELGAVSVTGSFSYDLSGLTQATTYYVRAYAVKAGVTSYGTQITFSTFFWLGSGAALDPYLIANKTDLKNLSENSAQWSNYFEQTADIVFLTADFESDGAFYNGGEGWIPIGNNITTAFTGGYNGDGHSIDGLYINRPAEGAQGLFGRATGDEIKNLGVTNVDVTGDYSVGGLVGQVTATVSNCYSTGSVSGNDDVGGLIGTIDRNSISDCYNTGRVTGTNYVGGLIGYGYSITASNCYNTGSVTGATFVGGVIGYHENLSSVSNTYNTGSVSGIESVGGFVGYNGSETSISNCYTRGDVTRSSGTEITVGGFAGENYATLEYSYSTGKVFYTGDMDPTDKGFAGFNGGGTYTNNFYDAELSIQSSAIGATEKTTSEMKSQSTFTGAGWSTSTWYMDTGINDGYPYLSWQNPGGSPMPVEFTSFIAFPQNSVIELQWNTATEQNNYGFEIERRASGGLHLEGGAHLTWNKIGFVEGNGTTNSPKAYSYSDRNISMGKYSYRLKQIDRDGKFTYSAQVEVSVASPAEFALMQNHPNPFNPSTSIRYQVAAPGHVSLKVYDMLGKEVATLVNGMQDAGAKIAKLDASQLPSGISAKGGYASGVYFYTLRTNNFTATKKMLLLK